MTLNWNLWRGQGIETKKPSVGVWIFSGTTHSFQMINYASTACLHCSLVHLLDWLLC